MNPSPKENQEIFGQEVAEKMLSTAWIAGRLPSAWLFSGPRGIGKATLAHKFSRYVISNGRVGRQIKNSIPQNIKGDAENTVFSQTAAGTHPDILTLNSGSPHPVTGKATVGISVSHVREAVGFMRLTPAMGGWRVVIIDSADAMNKNAGNALLKSLEEPPKKAFFILISHSLGSVLPTVRSRCQRISMPPLSDILVSSLYEKFRPDTREVDRKLIMSLANGSIGEAIAINDMGGAELYREIVRILGTIPDLDISAVHALGDKLTRGAGAEYFAVFSKLIDLWLSRIICNLSSGRPQIELVEGEGAVIKRIIRLYGLGEWLIVWERVSYLLASAENANLDRKQVIIGVFCKLASVTG